MQHETFGGRIISWFAGNPVAANLLLVLVIALGVSQMGSLRKEAFPSMEPDSLSISVSYNSGSAQQAEEGLAIKIEDQLEGLSGIKTVTSQSTGSGVTVTVEKQSGYDLDTLLRDVKTRVDAISTFPAEARDVVIEKAQREEHALWLQLHGDADRAALQKLADRLKTDLLAQADIDSVTVGGWLDPMMIVEVDEARLQAYGLALSDVEDAINAGSLAPVSAVLRNETTYLQIQAARQAYRQDEFASIPLVSATDGRRLLLGEVARVHDGWNDNSSALSRFDGADSIGLQVITTGAKDISDSVAAAHKVAERWRAEGRLPQGVALATWYDRSTNIEQRLELLIKNAASGMVLVFVLLALFLNLTVAFWVAAGLPFVFFGTLYFMGDGFMGLSLNEFTTFGFILALGIVVDDAIVVGESIYTVREREGDTLANTIKGTLQVATPTLFGVLTTVAAFYALSQVSGGLGQLYSQFAAIVAVCLILSVVESKLILPAHLAHLNTRRHTTRNRALRQWQRLQRAAEDGLELFSARVYQPVVARALHHRYAVVVLFIAFAALVVAMPFTGAVRLSFFPDVPGDTVRAELVMYSDASVGQTHAALSLLERRAYEVDAALRGKPDAAEEDGRAIASLQVLSEADQAGKVTVELAAAAPYDVDAFTREWRARAGQPEGVRSLAIQSAPGMVDALRVELRADDDETLDAAGQAFRRQLQAIPGVSGIEDNLEPGLPQLHLELNAQGRALGLTTEMLAGQIRQAFAGRVVQRYQRNRDEIEVRVRYPETARQSAADVREAKIRTAEGTVLPLSSIATVSTGYTRDTITRIDGKRAVYISADVDKEALSATELVSRLKRDVVPELRRQYPGVDVHFAGEAEEQAETQSSMVSMFLMAMLIIYMLLAIPLRSYIQPVLIMTAVPFGIVGAILGHWITGLSLSILSLNGIVALSGVVVNDSLLLVTRFNELRAEGVELAEAIAIACRSRLRAVLLTSLTTFAGLAPLLLETERQAQFLIPAVVSLAYGIMFATMITLILIPSLLLIQHETSALLARLGRRLCGKQSQPC